MGRKRFTPEDIIGHLRTVEIESGKGVSVQDACRKLGICEQTYYRWKREYGGLRVDQAKRLKSLEQENARLKRLVADFPWTKRFCRKSRRETSKPGPTTGGRRVCATTATGVGTPGVSRVEALSSDPTLSPTAV